LSCVEDRSGGEDVLPEEAQTDKVFQVPSVALSMGHLVSLVVIEGAVLFCFGEYGAILDWLQTSYLALKTSLMGSISGVKCCSTLKAQSGFRERIGSAFFLKVGCLDSGGMGRGVSCCKFIFSPSLLCLREWRRLSKNH